MRIHIFSKSHIPVQYFNSFLRNLVHPKRYNKVQCFIMFIGYPRSGHTLIGSLLDAHPNIVIAQEIDCLQYFKLGFTRNQIFGLLLRNSQINASNRMMSTGYSYAVPTQHQGSFTEIIAIGSKKGGNTSSQYSKNPRLANLLREKIKIKVIYIHVYRNPFDNITTWARGGNKQKKLVNDAQLYTTMLEYFTYAETIAKLKMDSNIDMVDIKHEDFVSNPKAELKKLINRIGLEASDDYLSACSSIVFGTPKVTRHDVAWPDSLINAVMERMSRYDWLKGYKFDN